MYLPRLTSEMYKYSLELLQAEETISFNTKEFLTLLMPNTVGYINFRADEYEYSQKSIDDLRKIIKYTTIYNTGKNTPGEEVFLLPVEDVSPHGYMRLLNIQVKMDYKNSSCFPDGIGKLTDATKLNADEETRLARNPYRRPRVDGVQPNIYYDSIGDAITIRTDSDSVAKEVKIKHFVYPQEMSFVPDSVSELSIDANIAICKQLVTQYLGVTESPRYPQNVQMDMKEQNDNV
jgi:hypothetical protein